MLFKHYLEKNRWNYGSLAKALNVSRITIASWDKGTTAPSVYQAKKLTELLGVKLEDLFQRGENNETFDTEHSKG